MADNKEKLFNTYPLKDDIAKNDIGMLWNTASSEVNTFTMEKLTQLMIEAMKNNMTVDDNGILHL